VRECGIAYERWQGEKPWRADILRRQLNNIYPHRHKDSEVWVLSSSQGTADMIVNGLLALYNWFVSTITYILQQTIIKENPDIAREYGSAIALLVSLTAVYLLVTLISAFRKILGLILAIGWIVLIAALVMRIASPR